jgi:hypothetical protein
MSVSQEHPTLRLSLKNKWSGAPERPCEVIPGCPDQTLALEIFEIFFQRIFYAQIYFQDFIRREKG